MVQVSQLADIEGYPRFRDTAHLVLDHVIQVMNRLPKKRVDLFVIETPVLGTGRKNVGALIKQARFHQQLCDELWRYMPDIPFVEIHNATSKKNGTGNHQANKDEVAEAMGTIMPDLVDPDDYSWDDWYAICDATCHAYGA